MSVRPRLEMIPLDDAARDGRMQLVFDPADRFALVRWNPGPESSAGDGQWQFGSGVPIDFEPTHYQPKPPAIGFRHG